MKKCAQCQTSLPDEARFCHQCGTPQVEAPPVQEPPEVVTLDDGLEQLLVDLFFRLLQGAVVEQQDASKDKLYAERVYASGFRETLHRRVTQLAERLKKEYPDGYLPKNTFEERAGKALLSILDYFFIRYCEDLNIVPLPAAILQYDGVTRSQVDLYQMVLDYLDLDQEKETYYTDFLKMPIEKLKNAGKMYLFPEKKERILLICDQSLTGSGKEGFALTEAGLYWKAYLQKPKVVFYKDLHTVARDKDWILINGHFFSVNNTLNIKMLKLLRKIMSL